MRILLIVFSSFAVLTYSNCSSCSRSGKVKALNSDVPVENNIESNHPRVDHTRSGKVVIKMKRENGVYKIPTKINGTEMDFIFDTGAGIISISDLEASYLYKQGKISPEDIIGKEKFQDATGNISEGVIINLKEVTIGDRTINNVQASVTHNTNAPLLLGQTALEKFGQITIDYQNEEIIFQ